MVLSGTRLPEKFTYQLLLREFDTADNNTVRVNDIDIKQYDIKKLRHLFGYVPQDNFLFQRVLKYPHLLIPILILKLSIVLRIQLYT